MPSGWNAAASRMRRPAFSMMSPLVGVTALYPRDNVSLASHHLLLIEGEPLLFPLLFAAAQCALCAAAAALLLRAAERRLEWMD